MDFRVLRRKRASFPCIKCRGNIQRGTRRAEEEMGECRVGCGVWRRERCGEGQTLKAKIRSDQREWRTWERGTIKSGGAVTGEIEGRCQYVNSRSEG